MKIYDELKARGLIAQVTDEEEISEMIGFNNVPNFYTVFRSMTGETPARYRKRQRRIMER